MIEEAYVSFETAKLLKEKGFDEECCTSYTRHPSYEDPIIMCHDATTNSKGVLFALLPVLASAPTQQMAMKWLREVHNIDISIIPLRSNKEYLPRVESDILDYDAIPCREYEEACEAAFRYCLENLI